MLLMKCAELKEKVQKSRKARVCSPSASCGLLGRRDDAYNDPRALALADRNKARGNATRSGVRSGRQAGAASTTCAEGLACVAGICGSQANTISGR